jgi:hypothetical protein
MQDTVDNNEYNESLSTRLLNQCKCNKNTDQQHKKTKWASFTHSGKETKKITKVFLKKRK